MKAVFSRKNIASLLFVVAMSGGYCLAQSPSKVIEDFKASTLNQPGKEYPQVNSQGYARFKIEAPQAQSVVVSLGLGGAKGGTPLTKAEDGSWMGTTAGQIGRASCRERV